MLDKMNLLIPSAGSHNQHILYFKRLKSIGKVVTTEVDPLAPAIHAAHKCYRVPRIDSKGYLDAILEICQMEEINWIVPLADPDVFSFAKNREVFTRIGIKVFSPPPETVAIAADKHRTARFFQSRSIPHAGTYLLSELPEAMDKQGFPLFLKPRYMYRKSSAGYLVEVFNSRDELESYMKQVVNPEDYVLQEYLEGQEVNIDFFCAGRGEVIGIVPSLRLGALMPIFTKTGGAIVRGKTFHSELINRLVLEIADNLEFFGASNLQGFINGEGKIKFTEINPRFSGASVMAKPAGADFHRWAVRLMKGEKLVPKIDGFNEIYMPCWNAPIFFKEPPLQEIIKL